MVNYNTKEETKRCKTCNLEKTLNTDNFSVSQGYYRLECKECLNEKKRIYYQKNKEKARLYDAKKQREILESRRLESMALMVEGNWKKVKGYADYSVSDDGRVLSEGRAVILQGADNGSGYLFVNLWKNGVKKAYYIHRLVMTHFSEDKEERTVNHKDGVKTNNHIDNLEWMTYQDNIRHAHDTGLIGCRLNNPKTSLKVQEQDKHGNIIKVYPSIYQAERDTGISDSTIRRRTKDGKLYNGSRWVLIN